jgi:hypothetical protein
VSRASFDCSNTKEQEGDQAEPVTSSAKEANNTVSPMSAVSCVKLASIKTENIKIAPPAEKSTALSSNKKPVGEKGEQVDPSTSVNTTAKKYPIDDLIKAYLSQPKDPHLNNQALLSTMSPTASQLPSFQMILRSKMLEESKVFNISKEAQKVVEKSSVEDEDNSFKFTVSSHRQAIAATINNTMDSKECETDSPKESSSFDKNEVITDAQENMPLAFSSLKTPHEKKMDFTVAVVSPDGNVRKTPPPLSPCRQSGREVDELLSKTRNWLDQHSTTRGIVTTPNEQSLLSRQAPVISDRSIREEVETLKARRLKSDRSRQSISKSMDI